MKMFDLPPRPQGSVEQQIEMLWDYLYQLVQRMNVEEK